MIWGFDAVIGYNILRVEGQERVSKVWCKVCRNYPPPSSLMVIPYGIFTKFTQNIKKSHFNTISTSICSQYFTKISASESISFSIYHHFCRWSRGNVRVAKIDRKFLQNWLVCTKNFLFKNWEINLKMCTRPFLRSRNSFLAIKNVYLEVVYPKNFKILRKN